MNTSNSFDQLASLFQNFPPISSTPSSNSLLPTDDAKELIYRNYNGQLSNNHHSLSTAFKTAMTTLESHLESTISARYRDQLSHLSLLETETTSLSHELNTLKRDYERLEVFVERIVDPDIVVKKRVLRAFKSLTSNGAGKNAVIIRVCARERIRRVIRAWHKCASHKAKLKRTDAVAMQREKQGDSLRLEYSNRIDAV
jgi:hypothetical protein